MVRPWGSSSLFGGKHPSRPTAYDSLLSVFRGEYGENDICIGVPCIIGRNGVESIVDVQLNAEEQEKFKQSAQAVHKMNAALADL